MQLTRSSWRSTGHRHSAVSAAAENKVALDRAPHLPKRFQPFPVVEQAIGHMTVYSIHDMMVIIIRHAVTKLSSIYNTKFGRIT